MSSVSGQCSESAAEEVNSSRIKGGAFSKVPLLSVNNDGKDCLHLPKRYFEGFPLARISSPILQETEKPSTRDAAVQEDDGRISPLVTIPKLCFIAKVDKSTQIEEPSVCCKQVQTTDIRKVCTGMQTNETGEERKKNKGPVRFMFTHVEVQTDEKMADYQPPKKLESFKTKLGRLTKKMGGVNIGGSHLLDSGGGS